MARPRSEIRAEVKQAVEQYIGQLINESTATGTGVAVERNQLRPCHEQRRPVESRAARIPDYMNWAGCAPAGISRPMSRPHRHHWIEFQPNGSPEPPYAPTPPPPHQRQCPRYAPRDSMLAATVRPVCPEKKVRSGMCYTPSDYAWMDVPNPYLQPETGIYQAPHNTTYKRDYFGPDKGNADYLPSLHEWIRNASEDERQAAIAILDERGCPPRHATKCPTRPLGATRARLPTAFRGPDSPTAGIVTGLPVWAAANPIVKMQQARLLEAVQNCQTDGMRTRSSMMLLQDHLASTGYGLRPSAALPSHQRSGQGSYQPIDFPESGTQVVGRTVHPMFVIHPEWKSEKLQQQADRRKWDEKFNYYYV